MAIPVDENAVKEILANEEFSFLGLNFKGSLGEGRHSRYAPPLTNPILNETPYITTEARPFYAYNNIPND